MEIRRCQHLKTNGQQCGSPAMRAEKFCFFHKRWKSDYAVIGEASADPIPGAITFPVLEDYESIQMSILQIMHRLTTGHLDTKTGGLLLYALQIASSNLRYARFDPAAESVVIDLDRVPDTPLDANQWDEDEEEDDDDKGDGEGDEQDLAEEDLAEEDLAEEDLAEEDLDEEDLDEEDLNEELSDDAELGEQEPVGADAPVRPRAQRGETEPAGVRPRAQRDRSHEQSQPQKEEQPRISDAQFFQALANLCDHRENGTPLKFPVYPARPPKPCGAGALDHDEEQEKCGADIPVREKRPPAAVGSGTLDNGNKTSGG